MPTIIGRFTGATFQTELLVMNLLGLLFSFTNWKLGWANQVDAIRSSEHLSEIVKTVLCWVVKVRIIIADIYTITYLANFYSILTWCRERTLFPWMIVSACDNFLLENIGFIITLLLWMEKSISSVLFIEYIIVRAIPRIPALYYWCIINIFRADIREKQRRKLTMAKFNANYELLRNSFVADHLRFGGASSIKKYYEKSPRFASLTNLDDFSFYSSFDYDEDQDYYKRSKSLVTLESIDSLESTETEDYRAIQIFDDDSLTPTEKAMKLLDLNDDDINNARMRLGKNILPGTSTAEKIERIISTVEQSIADMGSTRLDRNVSSIAQNNRVRAETPEKIKEDEGTPSEPDTSLENVEQLAGTSDKHEKKSPAPKVRSIDRGLLPRVFQTSLRNPLSGCLCTKTNEESVETMTSHSLSGQDVSSHANHGYEEVDTGSRSDPDVTEGEKKEKGGTIIEAELNEPSKILSYHVPQSNFPPRLAHFSKWSSNEHSAIFATLQTSQRSILRSFFIHDLRKEAMNWPKSILAYPEDLQRANYELFRIDDITLEQSEDSDDNTDDRSTELFQEVHVRENLRNDAENWSNNAETSEGIHSSDIDGTSPSDQADISNRRNNASENIERLPETLPNPESHSVPTPNNFNPGFPDSWEKGNKLSGRLSRTRKRLENVAEREAWEMRALRAYNRLTLLEDKREMESKKANAPVFNRAVLQASLRTPDSTNTVPGEPRDSMKIPAGDKTVYEKIVGKLDRISKRESRSRPQKANSKLTTFNVNLDALRTSISLGFSSENKNRSKQPTTKNRPIYTAPITHQHNKKQSSKYSKPLRFQEDRNVRSTSVTRMEGYQNGHDLQRTRGRENITGSDPAPVGNHSRLESVFSETILSPVDNTVPQNGYEESDCPTDAMERQNKRRMSSVREAIMRMDWSFNNRDSEENIYPAPSVNVELNRANFPWDIVDDTNTITLLQSAFSSNLENTSRGFYLGPGSTELYTVSNDLDGVVEEIMKSARLNTCHAVFVREPSIEIDYGDSYLKEFRLTSIMPTNDACEDTVSESEAETDDTLPDDDDLHSVKSDPVEMSRNSYYVEEFDAGSINRSEKEKIEDDYFKDEQQYTDSENDSKLWSSRKWGERRIADILSEQELSHLDFWTHELKNLASKHRERESLGYASEFLHLTEMPGFCVVKMLVDFFRNHMACSRSTMTSGIFHVVDGAGTPNSSGSETVLGNQLNEASSLSLVNESRGNPRNLDSINNDITNHENFYFGTSDNQRFLVEDLLNFVSEHENNEFHNKFNEKFADLYRIKSRTIPEEIREHPIVYQSDAGLIDSATKSYNFQETSDFNSTFSSYDSLNSGGAYSNHSDSVISMGGHSSMDEFPRDEETLAISTESRAKSRNAIKNPQINRRN